MSWGPTTENVSCMSYGVYAQADYYQSWIAGYNTGASLTPLSIPIEDDTTESAGAVLTVSAQLVWAVMWCVSSLVW